ARGHAARHGGAVAQLVPGRPRRTAALRARDLGASRAAAPRARGPRARREAFSAARLRARAVPDRARRGSRRPRCAADLPLAAVARLGARGAGDSVRVDARSGGAMARADLGRPHPGPRPPGTPSADPTTEPSP